MIPTIWILWVRKKPRCKCYVNTMRIAFFSKMTVVPSENVTFSIGATKTKGKATFFVSRSYWTRLSRNIKQNVRKCNQIQNVTNATSFLCTQSLYVLPELTSFFSDILASLVSCSCFSTFRKELNHLVKGLNHLVKNWTI